MKKIKIRLPRKTIEFSFGFTTVPNQKAFEDDIKAYFNNKYPRMNFNNEDDFGFVYSFKENNPVLYVNKLAHRIQSSTTFSQTIFKDLNVIAIKYGYESIQFPLHYK